MGEIALAEEPFEIAVGGGANVLAAQGRLLVAVAHGIVTVALSAVVAVDESAGGDGFGVGSQGIEPSVIAGGYAIPVGAGRRAEKQASGDCETENCAETTDHRAPPVRPWNQLPIWGSSEAQPMR